MGVPLVKGAWPMQGSLFGVVVNEAHQRTSHVTTAEDPDSYPLVHQSGSIPLRRPGRHEQAPAGRVSRPAASESS